MPAIYKNGNIYGGMINGGNVWEGTQAQYDAITIKDPATVYYITDSTAPLLSAAEVTYSNTSSGLSATAVQGAIDEVVSDVSDKADKIALPDEYDATSTYNQGDFVIHNNNIYICTFPITTAEAWNSEHWGLVTPDTDYLHSMNPNGAGSFSLNRRTNSTVGAFSTAEGYDCAASDSYAHAEGAGTTASGGASHSEGMDTIASGLYSHAEGYNTTASGGYTHAEGASTNASGQYSHAECWHTTASGKSAHAEGYYAIASGEASHAEGYNTQASGKYGHVEGYGTYANHRSQHVFGEFNIRDQASGDATDRGNYIEMVGNGTVSSYSNARTLDWSGNEVLSGTLTASGLVLTGSITDSVLTSPRCEIASIQQSKCYQIGNIIFYSAELTFGSTIQTPGAVYFLHNKVTQSDFCWGTLFYDTGDLIYKVAKGYAQNMWVTNGTTRTQCSDVAGKSRMFLNLTIVKA